MRSTHHDQIIENMPDDTCVDGDCRHTNWGGRNRVHKINEDCPVYVRELRKLRMADQWAFADALKDLPRHDLNAKIKWRESLEEVAMPLEAFLALAGHFQGHVEFGIKQSHGGEGGDDTTIYSLAGMPFSDSRDLAEVAGKQLMQKFDSGWIEA